MAEKYTKEQFWKLYENLPRELKDALFAEETGDDIYNICKRNAIEENLEVIVDYVGLVLLGVLTPEDFQNALETELNLEKEVVKEVAREINRFIFYPVRPALEQLFQTEITPTGKTVEKPTIRREEEKLTKSSKKDTYREPIE